MAWLLLKAASRKTGHPEHRLRQWCKQKKIRFNMAGNRYIINDEWLDEDLEKMALENIKPQNNKNEYGKLRKINA
ncbi:hypothetical protein OXPF_34440 [Oxobacter pfennigii]|uniref:Helix-turn-helix domain protein n=1 Tax=Oxobacter pfennigii TaxID=36849 RepID=A0A0P8WXE5_9CLOT|nr:hypothetical protein [Oxobacter pfennigii]KPU43012.1 hypothetical protein OXPF_34440 [Oxobacter pfennigii]